MTERYYLEYKGLSYEELNNMLEKRLDKLSKLYGQLREAVKTDNLESYWKINEELRDIRSQIGAIQILKDQKDLG